MKSNPTKFIKLEVPLYKCLDLLYMLGKKKEKIWWGSKNDGFPQQPWVFVFVFFAKMKKIKIKKKNNNINYIIAGFPTKNDQHLGCEMGVPPFKETPIYSPNHGDESNGRIPKKSTEETNPR